MFLATFAVLDACSVQFSQADYGRVCMLAVSVTFFFNHSAAASVSVINITENILNIVSYHIGREQLDL